MNVLFAAAFVLLLWKPFWLFAVGFQLSFVAVLSLMLFYERIYKWYYPKNIVTKYVWKIVAASVAAEILIAPLVIFYFHHLPAMFLVANIIATFLMFFVVVLGLAIIAFNKIAVFAHFFAGITICMVRFFHFLINGLQECNPQSFHFLHLSILELLWVYGIIGFTGYFIIHKKKQAIFFSLGSTLLLLISFTVKNIQAAHQETIVVYNISQHAHTELIYGKNFTVISEDTSSITPKVMDYAVKENHIIHSAWREKRFKKTTPLMLWQDKKILFLKQPLRWEECTGFPVDYLIVEYPVSGYHADKLQNIFQCQQMIITGRQYRNQILKWKDSCSTIFRYILRC